VGDIRAINQRFLALNYHFYLLHERQTICVAFSLLPLYSIKHTSPSFVEVEEGKFIHIATRGVYVSIDTHIFISKNGQNFIASSPNREQNIPTRCLLNYGGGTGSMCCARARCVCQSSLCCVYLWGWCSNATTTTTTKGGVSCQEPMGWIKFTIVNTNAAKVNTSTAYAYKLWLKCQLYGVCSTSIPHLAMHCFFELMNNTQGAQKVRMKANIPVAVMIADAFGSIKAAISGGTEASARTANFSLGVPLI